MPRLTKQELETKNETLRTKLEAAHRIISDALDYDTEEEDNDDDQDDDDQDDDDEGGRLK